MAWANGTGPQRLLGLAGGALAVLSLVVLFGTLSLRWMVSDVGWYVANFERNSISERTGIVPGDLSVSAEEISRYLLLEPNQMNGLSVTVWGEARPLFNERERLHLSHVQELLGRFYSLQLAAGIYLAVYLGAWRALNSPGLRRHAGRGLRLAAILTVGAFGAFGLLSLLDFDGLFLQFHLASFQGNCWLFDPTVDNLVRMFPQVFWNDSAIRLALLTAAQALAALTAGTLLTRPNPAARRG